MIKNHPSYYQFLVSNYCLPTLFDKEPKKATNLLLVTIVVDVTHVRRTVSNSLL